MEFSNFEQNFTYDEVIRPLIPDFQRIERDFQVFLNNSDVTKGF